MLTLLFKPNQAALRSVNRSFNLRIIHSAVFIAVVFIGLSTSQIIAADQKVSWRFTDPMGKSPNEDPYDAEDNPDGWRNDTNNTGEVDVMPNGCIYFGMMNDETPSATKSVWLDLNWFGYNPRTTFGVTAVGYYQGMPVAGNISSVGNNKKIRVSWPENCPKWEYIKLNNKTTTTQTVTIRPSLKQSKCYKPKKRSVDGGPGPEDTFEITEGTFGVLTEMLTPMRITEIQMFPEHQEINPAILPEMTSLPHTGNWAGEFTGADPFGTARIGVRFVTDGPGLMVGDMYDLNFTMFDSADTRYTLFAFDAESGDWTDYIVDLYVLPWYEDFEIYEPDELLHGSSSWQGWDDDPVFDAPVSQAQSRSGPNALEVKDDTDIVRVFDGADTGHWSFEAWQYIPSDFVTQGTGDFAGSFFNLLNTYSPGSPHLENHWSVQIQFDPNVGLCKVFYGDGLNTIDFPYDVDRWVKIQVEVDLDKDWTRIYYDNDFVTEYSWIGGVIGGDRITNGIMIVDLFANTSSSIYYDDFSLVRVIDAPCLADLDGNGELNFFDVSIFLTALGSQDPIADFDGNNQWNFFDVSSFLMAYGEGCP
jgi:hypothetical protein